MCGGGHVGGRRGISGLCAQFCYEPKTDQKIKFLEWNGKKMQQTY